MARRRKGSRVGPDSREPEEVRTFGDRVRSMRVPWGWSQTQLADALGVDQKTVSRWEVSPTPGIPSDAALKSLEGMTGLSATAWLTGEGWALPDPPLKLHGHLIPNELGLRVIGLPERGHGIWHINPVSESDCNELTPVEAIKMIRDNTRTKGTLYLISSLEYL